MNIAPPHPRETIEEAVKMLGGVRYVACAFAHRRTLDDDAIRRAREILTIEERRGAAGIHSPTRRTEYILGRAAARRLIGAALGMDPIQVPLETVAGAKPRLRGTFQVSDFSVSHSRGWILVGITAHGDIGVDVEAGRTYSEALAQRSLDLGELAQVVALEGDARTAAFLERWTVKEASLKAMGLGISDWGRSVCRGQATVDGLPPDVITLAPGVSAAVALRPRPGAKVPDRSVLVTLDEGWAVEG